MKDLPYKLNDKIGKVTFIREVDSKVTASGKIYRHAEVRCACGNLYTAEVYSLKTERSTRCKECKDRTIGNKNKTHGLSHTRISQIWYGMIDRCYNPTSKNYKWYGAEGKTVCDEWKNSLSNFYLWASVNGYEDSLEIDRIDNSKGYSPDNCRWATRSTQCCNTRLLHSTNTTGYRGVSRSTKGRWQTTIRVNGKSISLGSVHPTALDAAIAYDTYVLANKLEHTINGVT